MIIFIHHQVVEKRRKNNNNLTKLNYYNIQYNDDDEIEREIRNRNSM